MAVLIFISNHVEDLKKFTRGRRETRVDKVPKTKLLPLFNEDETWQINEEQSRRNAQEDTLKQGPIKLNQEPKEENSSI